MRWLRLLLLFVALVGCGVPSSPPPSVGQDVSALSATYSGFVSAWGSVGEFFVMPLSFSGDGPISVTFGGSAPGIYRDCACGPPTRFWGMPRDAGVYPVQVTATNAEGSDTQTITFHFRPGLAEAPVDSIPEGGYVVTTTPPLSGFVSNVEPGDEVHVSIAADAGVVVAVGPDGSWSHTLPPLPPGDVTVTSQVRNRGQDWMFPWNSSTRNFRVRPDAVRPQWSEPGAGVSVIQLPSLAGIGEATGLVSVLHGGDVLCNAVVDASGTWRCTPQAALPNGPLTLSLVQADGLGALQVGDSLNFVVDRGAPAIEFPLNGKTLSVTDLVARGRAVAGGTVTANLDDVVSVGPVSVTEDGRWEIALGLVNQGEHRLVITSADRFGAEVRGASHFNVDSLPPLSPTVEWPASDASITTGTPLFTGHGERGTLVELKIDGEPACATFPAITEVWRCAPLRALSEGRHTWAVAARDAADNVSAVRGGAFSVDLAEVPPIALEGVEDGVAQLPAMSCAQVMVPGPASLLALLLLVRRRVRA